MAELVQRRWRVGGSWGLTIVAEGDGEPDEWGRRQGDELLGMVREREVAEAIVAEHNAAIGRAQSSDQPAVMTGLAEEGAS